MKMPTTCLIALALAACTTVAKMPTEARQYPQSQSVVSEPGPVETQREVSLSSRDRELVEAARRALDRVRKRLDWLNGVHGGETAPMEPSR